MSRSNAIPRRAAKTVPAAEYVGLSASLLRKFRLKGSDDPGEKGPAFIKVSPYLILYEYAELDRWLDERRAKSNRGAGNIAAVQPAAAG
jgi:hypothetical protein